MDSENQTEDLQLQCHSESKYTLLIFTHQTQEHRTLRSSLHKVCFR